MMALIARERAVTAPTECISRQSAVVPIHTRETLRFLRSAYSVVVDDHFERLRLRALEALADNETGVTSDDDLIYVLETTCGLLERNHEAMRLELWQASADFETARYA